MVGSPCHLFLPYSCWRPSPAHRFKARRTFRKSSPFGMPSKRHGSSELPPLPYNGILLKSTACPCAWNTGDISLLSPSLLFVLWSPFSGTISVLTQCSISSTIYSDIYASFYAVWNFIWSQDYCFRETPCIVFISFLWRCSAAPAVFGSYCSIPLLVASAISAELPFLFIVSIEYSLFFAFLKNQHCILHYSRW